VNDFIAPTLPIGPAGDAAAGIEAQAAAPSGNFATWFEHQVGELDTHLASAEKGVQQLAAGDAASLHDVMIRMEEAKLAFHLAVQVRSRLLDAYQEVMRMQV
jgi:flagellar hook-basal body complex protein FliE